MPPRRRPTAKCQARWRACLLGTLSSETAVWSETWRWNLSFWQSWGCDFSRTAQPHAQMGPGLFPVCIPSGEEERLLTPCYLFTVWWASVSPKSIKSICLIKQSMPWIALQSRWFTLRLQHPILLTVFEVWLFQACAVGRRDTKQKWRHLCGV